MKIEKFVVVLVAENGDKRHLKMSVHRDGNTVEIHVPEGADVGAGNIYLIGKEIAKQALYNDKYDYKVRFSAKEHIEVAICSGGKTYVGGTGKTPKHRDIKARILEYENALDTAVKSSSFDGENIDKEQEQNDHFVVGIVDDVCALNKDDFNGDKREVKSVEKLEQNDFENACNLERKNHWENQANSAHENGVQNTDSKGQNSSERVVQNSGVQKVEEHPNLDNGRHSVFAFESDAPIGQKENDKQAVQREENRIFSFDTVRFDGNNFYLSVKPQLDEIFVCYPEDELLNTTVPNSKWVRIDTQDGYYVVGLVLDGDDVSYICYGVPSTDKTAPPAEIKDLAVWLSTAENNGKGYWVIYQDALTGKCLK